RAGRLDDRPAVRACLPKTRPQCGESTAHDQSFLAATARERSAQPVLKAAIEVAMTKPSPEFAHAETAAPRRPRPPPDRGDARHARFSCEPALLRSAWLCAQSARDRGLS